MSLETLASTLPRRSVRMNDGTTLSIVDIGEGQPIVVLPSWTNSAAEYSRLIQYSSGEHRVVAVDMRGHGLSEKTEHGYRISRFSADLRDILTALDLDKAILVGHSLGCAVIWSYLDLFGSSRISALVLA